MHLVRANVYRAMCAGVVVLLLASYVSTQWSARCAIFIAIKTHHSRMLADVVRLTGFEPFRFCLNGWTERPH